MPTAPSLERAPEQKQGQEARLRGVHHLALNTDDMALTIDFYTNVLGLPMVHALRVEPGIGTGPNNRGNPPWENLRHYFFDIGNDSLLAFFEIPKGAMPKGDRNAIAAMQHVAFAATAATATVIRQRLEARGIDYLGPINVGAGTYSIYFFDPNGIRLEVSCQPKDGDDIRVIEAWTQTKTQALAELRTLKSDPAWLDKVTENLRD
ncbi:MAG TPA: VOC family protein [Stellaceae bacterium]|nr:VOC family protein [Stellaceae bacterium]